MASPVIAAPEVQQEFLIACGWLKTDVTYRPSSGGPNGGSSGFEQLTWWKKKGHEYPQHFAVWMERKGLV